MSNSNQPSSAVNYIALTGVSRSYPDRAVLSGVSLTVAPGERVALVGQNGAGKSTLLRLVAGLDTPDAGSLTRPNDIGLVTQQLDFEAITTVGQVLEAAVAQARRVETELEATSALLGLTAPTDPAYPILAARYDAALALANLTDVWSLDSRLDQVMAGLGLGSIKPSRLVEAMSGGQRSRLALAAILVAHPLALLADEPTNHLDDDGLDFLAAQLCSWGGPVLFASHDRVFLDDVATRIVDLDPAMAVHQPGQLIAGQQGLAYSGNYTDYLAAKAQARHLWDQQYQREQAQRNELRHAVAFKAGQVFHTTAPKGEIRGAKKFYSDKAATTVTRRVRAAQDRLDDLERRQVSKPPAELTFKGWARDIPSTQGTLVDLQAVGLGDRLGPTDLTVIGGDRVLITGPNGCGKSTLLAILAGNLVPDQGERLVRKGLRMGLLAQETNWADLGATAEQAYRQVLRQPDKAPSLAGSGLLAARDLGRALGVLSVGQRRRLQLAVLMAEPPDLLILDEPTNHLALELIEELAAALPNYPGAVVVASHDRRWRHDWPGRTVVLPGITVAPSPNFGTLWR